MWINGGKQIAYLSGKSGDSQLWIMEADGSNARQISHHEKGINGFLFSPDEKQILFIGNVKYSQKASDIYPDLDKATGRVIDDLMYKHWDEWVEEIPHPYIASFDGKELSGITDIMEGEPYESPMKPFGGIESFAWTPDSKAVAYTSRKKTGLEYSISTNSDIYLYDLATKQTRNLTEGMMGYDTTPTFSPDGKYLAWGSMERDGYESDKNPPLHHEHGYRRETRPHSRLRLQHRRTGLGSRRTVALYPLGLPGQDSHLPRGPRQENRADYDRLLRLRLAGSRERELPHRHASLAVATRRDLQRQPPEQRGERALVRKQGDTRPAHHGQGRGALDHDHRQQEDAHLDCLSAPTSTPRRNTPPFSTARVARSNPSASSGRIVGTCN